MWFFIFRSVFGNLFEFMKSFFVVVFCVILFCSCVSLLEVGLDVFVICVLKFVKDGFEI